MRKKWVVLSFVLGLGVMLDVTPAQSQFGDRGGKGKGGKGERGMNLNMGGGGFGGSPNVVVAPGGFGGNPRGFGGNPGAGFNGGGAGFNGGGFGGNPGMGMGGDRGGFNGGGFNGMGGDRGMGGMGMSKGGDRGMGGPGFGGGGMGMGGDRGMGGDPRMGGMGMSKGGDPRMGGGGGESRRPQIDPEQSWNMLVKVSGGTNTIKFDNIPPDTKRMLKMFAERQGTPALPESGEWSKDQFMAHASASAELMRMGGSGNGAGNDWGRGGDRGGDSFDPRSMGRGREKKDEEEERPVAIRYGKLPKDAPAMFTEMDGDRDGQIGLYEWRNVEGNSILAFQAMDLNGDGLLTVDEYLRYQQQKSDREKAIAYENGESVPKGGRGAGAGMMRGPVGSGKDGGAGAYGKDSAPNYFGPSDKSKDTSSKDEKRGKGGDTGRGPWGGGDNPRPKKGG